MKLDKKKQLTQARRRSEWLKLEIYVKAKAQAEGELESHRANTYIEPLQNR